MRQTDRKFVGITPPAAIVDNNAFTTATLDTKGFRFVELFVYLGATDIAMTSLKVQESDDSGMSGATDVPGCVVGTSVNTDGNVSSLPSATDDNKLYKFEIDMRGRKRYLDIVGAAGDGSTGTYLTAWAEMSEAEITPVSAANKGADEVLRAA